MKSKYFMCGLFILTLYAHEKDLLVHLSDCVPLSQEIHTTLNDLAKDDNARDYKMKL